MSSLPGENDPVEPLPHLTHLPPLPSDATRMGLDRNTEEGAIIAMAGNLNPTKPSHRVIAWVMLAAITVPVVYTILVEIF
jgi:hypothetical protein